MIELLDEVGVGLSNALIQNVAEGGHDSILSPILAVAAEPH